MSSNAPSTSDYLQIPSIKHRQIFFIGWRTESPKVCLKWSDTEVMFYVISIVCITILKISIRCNGCKRNSLSFIILLLYTTLAEKYQGEQFQLIQWLDFLSEHKWTQKIAPDIGYWFDQLDSCLRRNDDEFCRNDDELCRNDDEFCRNDDEFRRNDDEFRKNDDEL